MVKALRRPLVAWPRPAMSLALPSSGLSVAIGGRDKLADLSGVNIRRFPPHGRHLPAVDLASYCLSEEIHLVY